MGQKISTKAAKQVAMKDIAEFIKESANEELHGFHNLLNWERECKKYEKENHIQFNIDLNIHIKI